MPKRFTASEKWQDPWFRRLPPNMKLFWGYLLDNCTNAGIWDPDLELAEMYVGMPLKMGEVRNMLDGRIIDLPDGKWFIPKYITFQYGELNSVNPAHKNVISTLKRYGFLGRNNTIIEAPTKLLPSGSEGLKDKDKIKAKTQDKAKV